MLLPPSFATVCVCRRAALVCRSAALTTKRAAARTTSPSVLLPLKLIFVKLIFVVSLCLCGKAVSLRETEGASERERARARARILSWY